MMGDPQRVPQPPRHRPASPALIALHPHGRQFELGKSLVAGLVGDGTRAYGLAAARAGFAVLAPDMLGFEDHRPSLAARKGNYALGGEGYERLLAMEALVQGQTLQGWMLAELSACADALARDPRADAGRMALLGPSYGGQQALLGMLVDPRFKAGVVSCGFSLVQLLVERQISHHLALYVPGLLPDLDFDTLLPALAPRPLTVLAGRRDPIFPVEGVEAVEAAARRAWTEAGAPDALRFRYLDAAHDLPAEALEEALAWLAAVVRTHVEPWNRAYFVREALGPVPLEPGGRRRERLAALSQDASRHIAPVRLHELGEDRLRLREPALEVQREPLGMALRRRDDLRRDLAPLAQQLVHVAAPRLALDGDAVERPGDHHVLHQLVRGVADHQARPVALVQALEAAREVHRVTDHGVVEPRPAPDVPDDEPRRCGARPARRSAAARGAPTPR